MYHAPMSISPESIKGQATQTPGEVVMTMKLDDAKKTLEERIRGVIDRGDSHALLFVMKRDEISTVEENEVGRKGLKKGRLQAIALSVMSEFGFDPRTSQIEEISRTCEMRNYPSTTNEGLMFRRCLDKNERGNPITVTWTVHRQTPTSSS